MDVAQLIKDFGFPIIAAVGLGYFVYYVWQWSTSVVKPIIGDANKTLIALIDRVRMLDNDLIRLNQKLHMILEYQEKQKLHKIEDLEEKKDEVSKRSRKKTMGSN